MKILKGLFRLVLLIVCIAVFSAWLQDQGLSWADAGKYILNKGGTLVSKVGQDIITMDWTYKK